jgi:hypothetical protein
MGIELRTLIDEYGKAFADCHKWYQDYLQNKNPNINDGYNAIDNLRKKYFNLTCYLHNYLRSGFYLDRRGTEIASQVKTLFPVIFDNLNLKKNTSAIIDEAKEKAKSRDESVLLESLIGTMAISLRCFSGKSINYVYLRRFKGIPREDFVLNTSEITSSTIIIPDDEASGKSPITRDAIWFLFCTLRQKGVIKQMTDTNLSDTISVLTGYSAEQLRQSKLHTDKSKDKLVQFLKDLIEKVEG